MLACELHVNHPRLLSCRNGCGISQSPAIQSGFMFWDGVLTAHPYLKGEHLQDIVGKQGYPLGKEIMRTGTEGKINEVTYWWPRPGSDKPLEKRTFYTQVGGQNCGVGYYKA